MDSERTPTAAPNRPPTTRRAWVEDEVPEGSETEWVPASKPPSYAQQEGPIIDNDGVAIAVMGATGSGKTTFINTVSGAKMRTSSGLVSCTQAVEVTEPFLLDGRMVTLVDTPGFDDTNRSDTDVLKAIAHFLAVTYKKGRLLAGIIYIHRISDIRMGGTSTRNFHMFRKLCGDDTLQSVVIMTNMWGQVGEELGQSRERELKDSFFKPVLEKGAAMLRHDNTLASAQRVLRRFLKSKLKPAPYQIQTEIVVEKKDLLQTAAGEELNRELIEKMKRHEREMADLQQEHQAALDAKDDETRREIEAETEKLKQKTEQLEDDTRKLASDFQEENKTLQEQIRKAETETKEKLKELKKEHKNQMDAIEEGKGDANKQHEKEIAQLSVQIAELEKRNSSGGFWSVVGGALVVLVTAVLL